MGTHGSLRAGVVGVGVVLCTLLPGGPGAAQVEAQTFSVTRSAGAGSDAGPPVTGSHLDRYAEVLGLSDDQRAAARLLLDGMLERHTLAQVEMNEKLMDLRAEAAESGDFRIFMEEMPQVSARYAEQREAMEASFFDDLRVLLTPAQEGRWEGVERTKRRLQTIGHGSLAGEGVDLVELCDALEAPADVDAELSPLLDRYEVELDRALAERNELQGREHEMTTPRGPGEAVSLDVEKLMAITEEVREASVGVRDVNQSYARQIRGVLAGTPSLAERFDRLWRKWSFPKVYAETYTSRVMSAADGFEDLTTEQRDRLAMLVERYERELERANERWAQAIEESDAEGNTGIMMGGGGGGMMMIETGDEVGGPIDDARRARRDLNRDYLAQIRGLLSPDQRTRLPEREMPRPVGGGSPGGQSFEFVTMEVEESGEADSGGQ